MRRSSDAGLRGLANGGFPHLGSCACVNGNQPAITRAHINFAVPNGNALIDARGVRAVDSLIELRFGIEFPEQFSGSSIDGINLGQRSAEVDDSVDHDGLGDDTHAAFDVHEPGQTEIASVFIGDLLERTEMFGVKGAAIEQPIVSRNGFGADPRFGDVTGSGGFGGFICRRIARNADCQCKSCRQKSKNSPPMHDEPPSSIHDYFGWTIAGITSRKIPSIIACTNIQQGRL